jgi:hypothetical protein
MWKLLSLIAVLVAAGCAARQHVSLKDLPPSAGYVAREANVTAAPAAKLEAKPSVASPAPPQAKAGALLPAEPKKPDQPAKIEVKASIPPEIPPTNAVVTPPEFSTEATPAQDTAGTAPPADPRDFETEMELEDQTKSPATKQKGAGTRVETGTLAEKTDGDRDVSTADWCAQRHIERQQGKPPAGATSEADVQADNKICATVYRLPATPPQ